MKNIRAAASIKRRKVEMEGCHGYDYFQNLPDELLIVIFTKLSNASGHDTLRDVKLLGQCSTVCKRFDSLTSLVPTLFISHTYMQALVNLCPKILNKFKHIRSLRLEYISHPKGVNSGAEDIRYTYTKAIYDPPHNYSLAVLSSKSVDVYSDKKEYYPTRTFVTATDDDRQIIVTTQIYALTLFHLHHMLLSSIRENKLLRKVVVTDFTQRESFTLVEEQLVQLRNINVDLAQVQGCRKTGFCNILSVPLYNGGVLFKNITCNLFERWVGNSGGWDDDDIPQFEGNKGMVLQAALETMMESEADIAVDYKVVARTLSKRKYN